MLSLFFDEDSMTGVALRLLRSRGLDVTSVFDVGSRGWGDLQQLELSTSLARVLVTGNIQDFAKHHAALLKSRRHHAGIVCARQGQFTHVETARRLLALATELSPADMVDRLEYVSNWEPLE